MIFPLSLTPFEEYMLADGRPAYPMDFFSRLRFTGRFERATLDAALALAVSRHPLLGAVVQSSGRRWVWAPANDVPSVRWLDTPPGNGLPRLEPLDVRATPGVRLVASEGRSGTDLVVQIHHACCDGLSMFRFVEDMLVAYARGRGAAPTASLDPLDAQRLCYRGRFGLTAGRWLRLLPWQAKGLLGAYRFLARTPEPLVAYPAAPDDSRLPSDYPVSHTRRLTESETARALQTARTLGVTVNDLLVREFFLCLARYQWRCGANRDQRWLRVCVPINVRSEAEDRLPAANVTSMVFLDRQPGDVEDPQRLLWSIRDQMQLIKRHRLGLIFMMSLSLCRLLPGGLPRRCRSLRCSATGVLPNLGRLFACSPLADDRGRLTAADVVLQDVEFLSPVRPLTSVNVAALSYAGRLSFTLTYDTTVLTASEAETFIDDFTAGVRRSASAQPEARTEAR